MTSLVFNWIKDSKLGAGSYGTVYKGITTDAAYPVIAVKMATSPEAENLIEEYFILCVFEGCPNIVRSLGYEITDDGSDIAYFHMFLEYTGEGTLRDIIRTGNKLDEKEVADFARMILQGLRDVHKKGYVHCDLKPANILVFPGNQLKLADFGLSKRVGVDEVNDSGQPFRGTPRYMSPESVQSWKNEPPLDIWSLGCVVLEMFTGKPMWSASCTNNLGLLEYLICEGDVSLELPDGLSDKALDFLKHCFEERGRLRPNAEQLLNHPFVNENYMLPKWPTPREETDWYQSANEN